MQNVGYKTLLEISKRVNWRIEDIASRDTPFDFSKPFLPETFARTYWLPFLSAEDRLTLNHVRARGYVALFELVEQFVEPFVVQESMLESGDSFRAPALQQFAREETKHMELFRRVLKDFDDELGPGCNVIGPAEDIRRAVLGHDPLAVLILTLALEWMSQGHFVESIKDDEQLDPQFKSLLKHHWMEECQHARLDGLMLLELAQGKSELEIDRAIGKFLELVKFFDGGFKEQTKLDLSGFEAVKGNELNKNEREKFLDVQHQALRWTFLGSAMRNRNFLATLADLGQNIPERVNEAAGLYQ
jgi:hypothetical protein